MRLNKRTIRSRGRKRRQHKCCIGHFISIGPTGILQRNDEGRSENLILLDLVRQAWIGTVDEETGYEDRHDVEQDTEKYDSEGIRSGSERYGSHSNPNPSDGTRDVLCVMSNLL